MPPKGTTLADKLSKSNTYANIRTAVLDGLNAKLVIQYSNKELAFMVKKLVMPHKMYGFIQTYWSVW